MWKVPADLTSDGPNHGPNLITVYIFVLSVEQHAYLEILDISNTGAGMSGNKQEQLEKKSKNKPLLIHLQPLHWFLH